MSLPEAFEFDGSKVFVQDPAAPKEPRLKITEFTTNSPPTITVDGDPDLERGDVIAITDFGEANGSYIVEGVSGSTITIADEWQGKKLKLNDRSAIQKAGGFIEQNFCELTNFDLSGATSENRIRTSICGSKPVSGRRTEGTLTLSFYANPAKLEQQAISYYDRNRNRNFWIRLEFPDEVVYGYFYGYISTGPGLSGANDGDWTSGVTFQLATPYILMRGPGYEDHEADETDPRPGAPDDADTVAETEAEA